MSWRAAIAKREAALRRYQDSFVWRSLAVTHETERMIAAIRANPATPHRRAPRLNGGEDYELRAWPGDTLRDGMESPGT
jgi:hypothetical protein